MAGRIPAGASRAATSRSGGGVGSTLKQRPTPTTTTPLPYSKTVLGPLTTVYTPPSSCLTPWLSPSPPAIYYGLTCAAGTPDSINSGGAAFIGIGEACYPPGMRNAIYASWSATPTTTPDVSYNQLIFYSPGALCPSGFTTACKISRSFYHDSPPLTAAFAESQVWSQILPGEVAAACCPEGYACQSDRPETCTPVRGARTVSGAMYGSACAATQTSVVLGGGGNGSGEVEGGAYALYLVQTMDVTPAVYTVTSTPGSSLVGGGNGSGDGLSLGAKIAIGVAIPIAVISAVVFALLFWRYRRRHQVLEIKPYRSSMRESNFDRDSWYTSDAPTLGTARADSVSPFTAAEAGRAAVVAGSRGAHSSDSHVRGFPYDDMPVGPLSGTKTTTASPIPGRPTHYNSYSNDLRHAALAFDFDLDPTRTPDPSPPAATHLPDSNPYKYQFDDFDASHAAAFTFPQPPPPPPRRPPRPRPSPFDIPSDTLIATTETESEAQRGGVAEPSAAAVESETRREEETETGRWAAATLERVRNEISYITTYTATSALPQYVRRSWVPSFVLGDDVDVDVEDHDQKADDEDEKEGG